MNKELARDLAFWAAIDLFKVDRIVGSIWDVRELRAVCYHKDQQVEVLRSPQDCYCPIAAGIHALLPELLVAESSPLEFKEESTLALEAFAKKVGVKRVVLDRFLNRWDAQWHLVYEKPMFLDSTFPDSTFPPYYPRHRWRMLEVLAPYLVEALGAVYSIPKRVRLKAADVIQAELGAYLDRVRDVR